MVRVPQSRGDGQSAPEVMVSARAEVMVRVPQSRGDGQSAPEQR